MKYWRSKKDWSIERLAKEAGISEATIHRIETGKVVPLLRTLLKLAKALEIDEGQLAPLAKAKVQVQPKAKAKAKAKLPKNPARDRREN